MSKYDPNTREQIVEFKDGRILFKTHNGFKCFLQDKKGKVIIVSDDYYKRLKRSK
jgi:hypothetical protein